MNVRDEALLEKSERILKGNIYEPDKYKWGSYRMISPAMGHFVGVWNWDSAFHAIGMIPFDIEIAKEQIEGFLQFQSEDGMLPDVIFENGKISVGYTKPPVMAYAAERVYKASGDTEFVKRVYPMLVKNEGFWTKKRCFDGFFHYDADRAVYIDEGEYLKRVGYETGWDNSPRWDSEPQNCWAIDLNCCMVMMYDALAVLAEATGDTFDKWKNKSRELAKRIEERLWNDKLGSYTDYNFRTQRYSDTLTPASFMPLFAGIASKERAEKMNNIAKKHFLPGMPTVAYDDKTYDDVYNHAYWRGPCWLNVAYFAAKGLKNYGFNDTAETVRDTILNWVYNDGDSIHENYNATTGEGLCSDHFSWSCVFVREFIKHFD